MNSDTSSVWNFYARFRGETSSGVAKRRLFFQATMTPGHLTKLSLIYVKLQVSYIRDRHEAVTNWNVCNDLGCRFSS